MNRKTFNELLKAKWDENKFVCIGLDSDYEKIPQVVKEKASVDEAVFLFNKGIIDATYDLVCAYKPQVAFYEAYGVDGYKALEETVKYLHQTYPDIPVISDAKRADIATTNEGYTKAIFDRMGFDAVTVNPYLGKEALEPFLKYGDKGIIILVKTSNPGAGEFQDLKVDGKPLHQIVAKHVASDWNYNNNCGVVVGATYPEELKKVREIIGDLPILVPGIGTQGGDLEATLKNGLDSNKQGLIISSSRGIIFASGGEDFAEAARREAEKLNDQIKEALNEGV